MLYNFLNPKLLPKIVASSPSTDHFEATNLIADNDVIKARGFMAYSILKPPVEIEFEFICPVNIAYVSLRTSNGQQRSSGIEVLTRTEQGTYCTIGKTVCDCCDTIVFCNSLRFSQGNPPEAGLDQKALFYFRADTHRIFTNAKYMKIILFKTVNRTVPCLGAVKVVGAPSTTCSKATHETIERLNGGPKQPLLNAPTPAGIESEELDIPADFLDALTFEIMTLPMTLPSGKTIDRDTLDKHNDNEKSFGRQPGDPFTGLNFTESRKAVLNQALKCRIDMFLVQNSTHKATFGFKRTTGERTRLNVVKCMQCDVKHPLYSLPCQHFSCRTCLLALDVLKCGICGTAFNRTQAERFHAAGQFY